MHSSLGDRTFLKAKIIKLALGESSMNRLYASRLFLGGDIASLFPTLLREVLMKRVLRHDLFSKSRVTWRKERLQVTEHSMISSLGEASAHISRGLVVSFQGSSPYDEGGLFFHAWRFRRADVQIEASASKVRRMIQTLMECSLGEVTIISQEVYERMGSGWRGSLVGRALDPFLESEEGFLQNWTHTQSLLQDHTNPIEFGQRELQVNHKAHSVFEEVSLMAFLEALSSGEAY